MRVRGWPAVVALSAALCGTVIGVRGQSPAPTPPSSQAPLQAPVRVPPRPGPSWLAAGDPVAYVGSDACRRCHQNAFEEWRHAFHLQMVKPAAEARVLGDFSAGTSLRQNGRAYRFEQKDGRYYVSLGRADGPAERFAVDYTLGANRFQGYLSRLPDGRIYVLPVYWHEPSRRWVDWKEVTPVPDGDHDLRQIWNVNCFNCHATNLAKNYSVERRRYETSWTELGIGCEACHGPGAAHVSVAAGWEREPASRPELDTASSNRALSATLKIFSPRSSPARQVFDACAYCHGNKNNAFVGFAPGARYADYAVPFLASQPMPASDPQGEFWPDGRPSRFNRPQALMQSGCFERGEISCATCHSAHGSGNYASLKVPADRTDQLCLQCHGWDATPHLKAGTVAAITRRVDYASEAHTHHPAASPGSRCVGCHMGAANWRLLMHKRDHTFRPPVPEITAKYGAPNACTECHDDRAPEWAVERLQAWYGDQARRARAVRVADAFYASASGRADALPALLALLVDRREPAFTRATAAEFLTSLVLRGRGRTMEPSAGASQTAYEGGDEPRRAAIPRLDVTPAPPPASADPPGLAAVVNALIGAASDPEPVVRAAAIRALGAADDRRAVPSLAARLVDDARTVRIAAADALLQMGIATLPGAAGTALSRAQDEYAESLGTFGDMAGDHLALGWVQMQRQRDADAVAAFGRALALAPDDPQPRVFLGVIAARQGRFDEAIREWKRVKSARPDYPNIDRLIAEAERRRAGE